MLIEYLTKEHNLDPQGVPINLLEPDHRSDKDHIKLWFNKMPEPYQQAIVESPVGRINGEPAEIFLRRVHIRRTIRKLYGLGKKD